VTVNDELKRIQKETIMHYFKIISQKLLRKTEENHELQSGEPASGQYILLLEYFLQMTRAVKV
jgi:hypothetical protein